jgi:hypothetical protein
VSTLFVSYARKDRAKVDELTRRLPALGHQVWVDAALRGGQSWWEEILERIASCDAFVAVVSSASLSSVACARERSYAIALGKPILPIAVAPMTQAMPRELSVRQVVDYSTPGEDAAFALAGAIAGLPPAPPLPDPLPEPPGAPLSYLTDLVEEVDAPGELTRAQQRRIVEELEPALRSADEDEQAGGRRIVQMLQGRDDLYADTERRLRALETVGAGGEPAARGGASGATSAAGGVGTGGPSAPAARPSPAPPSADQRLGPGVSPGSGRPSTGGGPPPPDRPAPSPVWGTGGGGASRPDRRRSNRTVVIVVAAVVGMLLLFVLLATLGALMDGGGYGYY